MGIKENIEQINDMIKDALERAGRTDNVDLVAATKYVGADKINEAIDNGIKIIGENRIQDAIRKFEETRPVQKHFIGHLQTNKIKLAVKYFDCIQTVDSLKLAEEINKRTTKTIPVFIQINISGEEQKHGINPGDEGAFYDHLIKFEKIDVSGLMGMPPFIEAEETRIYYKKMRKISDELKLKHLSMGMSNDFEVAIEEGSTMVRVGSKIFQ